MPPRGDGPTVPELRARLGAAGVRGASRANRAELLSLCERHNVDSRKNSSEPARARWADLPTDLLLEVARHSTDAELRVLRSAASDGAACLKAAATICRTLAGLGGACRQTRRLVLMARGTGMWDEALRAFAARDADHGRDGQRAQGCAGRGTASHARALCLVARTGCELCGAARVRKVHWGFGVRCCQPCLYERTISEYRLKTPQERLRLLPVLLRGLDTAVQPPRILPHAPVALESPPTDAN